VEAVRSRLDGAAAAWRSRGRGHDGRRAHPSSRLLVAERLAGGLSGRASRGRPGFGYAYGTLTNHAESGEELFEVSIDPASGEVRYRIRAASKPRAPLARLGYPIVRTLQARFRRDSVLAMRRALDA
jgi:hypothetical protein